jgi:hypothetical protein
MCQIKSRLLQFITYKTDEKTSLQRRKRAIWTINAKSGAYPSVETFRDNLCLFFGYIYSELKIPVEKWRFIMLSDYVLLTAFETFLKARNEGASTSLARLAPIGKGMIDPITGFVKQQIRTYQKQLDYLEFAHIKAVYLERYNIRLAQSSTISAILEEVYCLFEDVDDAPDLSRPIKSARYWCELNFCMLKKLESHYHVLRKEDGPNSPHVRLEWVLQKQHPISVIFDLAKQAEKYCKMLPIHHQDRLDREFEIALLHVVAGIPLRAENLTGLTLPQQYISKNKKTEDGSADLAYYDYKPNLILDEKTKLWSVKIPRHQLKNRQSLPKNFIYKATFPSWAQPVIDDYISFWRPKLPGAQIGSKYLFAKRRVTKRSKPFEPYTPRALSHPMQIFTLRFLKRNPEDLWGQKESLQWLRHVMAVEYIRNNPNSYRAATALLCDRLETVMETYARYNPNDDWSYVQSHSENMYEKYQIGKI